MEISRLLKFLWSNKNETANKSNSEQLLVFLSKQIKFIER